jgi:hypothetical protein
MGRGYSIGSIVYAVVGLVLASNYGYLVDLNSLSRILSAVLAVVFWPLLLVGVNMHLVF